jgi:hypothetical protein
VGVGGWGLCLRSVLNFGPGAVAVAKNREEAARELMKDTAQPDNVRYTVKRMSYINTGAV